MTRVRPLADLRREWERACRVGAEHGWPHTIGAGSRELVRRVASSLWYYRIVRGRRTFSYQGRAYRYFFHPYNSTWKTERAVEVPIVRNLVRRRAGGRLLEVGNVLSHYYPCFHDVVDKYERGPGVMNVDIVDYEPRQRYDLIVSISTLEHVGWDEVPRDPAKLPHAVTHLRTLMQPGGMAVVTLPLAYNEAMDVMLRDGTLTFDRLTCLKRMTADNRWAEVDWTDVASARFNQPFRGINGLVIATLT